MAWEVQVRAGATPDTGRLRDICKASLLYSTRRA